MKSYGRARTVSVRGFCAALALGMSLNVGLAQEFRLEEIVVRAAPPDPRLLAEVDEEFARTELARGDELAVCSSG